MDGVEPNRARSWRRLHLSTWLFLVLPGILLALAMIPGEREAVFDDPTCDHGWPCTWLSRQGLDGREPAPWALTEDVAYLNCQGLAADLCIAALLMSSIAAAVEWRRRRRRRVWQFTVGDLLAVMLIIGFPLKIIADRRAALARFSAAANGVEPTWEVALPVWAPDWLYDSDFVFDAIFWLGAVRPDDQHFDLPADQSHLRAVRTLLDCGAQNIFVTVNRPRRSGDGIASDQFDATALRSLVGLQRLILERADDDVLDCLDSLPELRSLTFGDDCGPISPNGAARLKGLRKLRVLRASRKCLGDAGIAALASLKTLEGLSLDGATDADLVQFSNLSRLRGLSLLETKATDAGLARLAALSRLQKLQLSGYRISGAGLAPLASLPRLTDLDLWGCGLTDAGLAGVEQFTSLRMLRLGNTPLEGGGLSHLANCRKMRQLDLPRAEINDAGLASLPPLPRLEDLRLDGTRISEQGLAHVNRLTSLRELWLTSTRATNLRALDLTRLPKLMLIDFDNSWVDRQEYSRLEAERPEIAFSRVHRQKAYFPSDFQRQLQWARSRPPNNEKPLHVSLLGPDFGNLELAALHGLAALESLRLNSSRVSDEGLAALAEFDRLQQIDLTDTTVGNAGLDALSKLPRLKSLDLSYTAISGTGLAKLADFPALEVIGLDPSQVTHRAIVELKRIPALRGVIVNRERAPWGKQYRGARDFDEFMSQLRHDLPGIDVSLKEYFVAHRCIED